MQRKALEPLVAHEMKVLESTKRRLRNQFASLYTLGQHLTSLIIARTTDVHKQLQQQQEVLVKAMDRILSLVLPKELEQARRFRDSVLELRGKLVDAEFDVEQLEARRRHLRKRGMSQTMLQVHLLVYILCVWMNIVGVTEVMRL